MKHLCGASLVNRTTRTQHQSDTTNPRLHALAYSSAVFHNSSLLLEPHTRCQHLVESDLLCRVCFDFSSRKLWVTEARARSLIPINKRCRFTVAITSSLASSLSDLSLHQERYARSARHLAPRAPQNLETCCTPAACSQHSSIAPTSTASTVSSSPASSPPAITSASPSSNRPSTIPHSTGCYIGYLFSRRSCHTHALTCYDTTVSTSIRNIILPFPHLPRLSFFSLLRPPSSPTPLQASCLRVTLPPKDTRYPRQDASFYQAQAPAAQDSHDLDLPLRAVSPLCAKPSSWMGRLHQA